MNTSSQSLISTKEYKKEDEQKVRNWNEMIKCVFYWWWWIFPSKRHSFSWLLFSIVNASQCLMTSLLYNIYELKKFENAALSLQLGPPSTLIRRENRAFQKRFWNWRNLKTPAFMLWLLCVMTSDYLNSTSSHALKWNLTVYHGMRWYDFKIFKSSMTCVPCLCTALLNS